MFKKLDLVGQRFGRGVVLQDVGRNKGRDVMWLCRCDCTNEFIASSRHLVRGATRSCGCLRREITGARSFKNCIGQCFNWLVVLQSAGRNKHGDAMWFCRCDYCGCGNEVIVSRNALARGHTRSCGCFRREMSRKRRTTHGMSRTREYRAYQRAKNRCTNPNSRDFADYGERGIEFRLPKFELFYAALGPCPPGKTLNRINNDGHYELGNVEWATPREQANNRRKRRRRRLTVLEHLQTVARAAQEFNVPLDAMQALQARIRASQGEA